MVHNYWGACIWKRNSISGKNSWTIIVLCRDNLVSQEYQKKIVCYSAQKCSNRNNKTLNNMSLIKILGLTISLILLSTVLQIPNKIRMLTADTFHEGEVYYSEKSEIWFGLYNEKDTFFLKETMVNYERVNDPVLEMEDEKSGIQITAEHNENLIILFDSSFSNMACIPLQTSLSTPLIMYPGDSVDISLSDSLNTILFTQNGFVWIEADKKQQKLASVYPEGIDESLTIQWAGDLDGDTKVDLIINDIYHYNIWINYRLFLSSYAETDEIVKEVASLTGQGC